MGTTTKQFLLQNFGNLAIWRFGDEAKYTKQSSMYGTNNQSKPPNCEIAKPAPCHFSRLKDLAGALVGLLKKITKAWHKFGFDALN